MTLPPLDIPFTLVLPFQIPLLVHPVAVHFAIALPVIILLLELSNMLFKSSIEIENIEFKRRAMSVTSLFLSLLLVAIYFAAFFTGKVDGSESGPLLSSAGQEELKEHKLIGTYLVYASIVLVAMKAFSMLVSRGWAKLLFILLLVGFIAGSLKQGKDGGELVYEHGANVKIVSTHENTIDDLTEEFDELTVEVDELTKELDTLKVAHEAELKAVQEKLDASKAVSGASLEAVEEVQESVEVEAPAIPDTVVEVVETQSVEVAAEELQEAVTEVVETIESQEPAVESIALPGTEVNATH